MIKKARLLTLLVLLMTATGAWATTFTTFQVGDVFKVGDVIQPATSWNVNQNTTFGTESFTLTRGDVDGTNITENQNGGAYYVFKIGSSYTSLSNAFAVTDKSDGLVVKEVDTSGTPYKVTLAVHETNTVNLNDGTLNPTTWQGKAGNSDFGPLPIKAATGEKVSVKYVGTDGREVKRITAVTGALTGKFTVSATGKKVVFSQGNLQAVCTSADENGDTQETWTWRFAANQWDCIGGANYNNGWIGTLTGNNHINGNGSTSAPGTVDLFGWVGKSNTTWTGAAMYGISNDPRAAHYAFANNELDELKSDWGNTIDDGWFTLTKDEWKYLISSRTGANQKYGYGSIGGVNGLILLPDSWTQPEGTEFTAQNTAWNGTNSYTTEQWAKMEAAGAVFLPAAGWRDETQVNNVFVTIVGSVGSFGCYMSSSINTNTSDDGKKLNYTMQFNANEVKLEALWGHQLGFSVRLVRQTK